MKALEDFPLGVLLYIQKRKFDENEVGKVRPYFSLKNLDSITVIVFTICGRKGKLIGDIGKTAKEETMGEERTWKRI